MASGVAPAAPTPSDVLLRLDDAAWNSSVALVEATMARAVAQQGNTRLSSMIEQHLAAGGKRLRARLALAACQALGASSSPSVAWAASCELMHNATLVHDDVQDGDAVRRGQPTVWRRHGIAQAINVGDLMLMIPYQLVTSPTFDVTTAARLARTLADYIGVVISGQADECAMTDRQDGDLEQYVAMVRGKTAALFELPVVGAAIVAQFAPEQARRMAEGFAPLGVLFQLQDDVIDLFGDKGRNQVGADICEGKMSALVLEHIRRCPDQAPWLLNVLRAPRERTSSTDVASARQRFLESGALGGVLKTINAEADRARSLCDGRLAPLLNQLIARITAPLASLEKSLPSISSARQGASA